MINKSTLVLNTFLILLLPFISEASSQDTIHVISHKKVLVKTNPANWYISGDDANRVRYAMGLDQFMFKGINRGGAVNRRGYEQKQSEKDCRKHSEKLAA